MNEERITSASQACPHCGGADRYVSRVSSGSGHGPYLLQGLGSFLHFAAFDVIVCADCGLTQFFAEPAARLNVRSNAAWEKL